MHARLAAAVRPCGAGGAQSVPLPREMLSCWRRPVRQEPGSGVVSRLLLPCWVCMHCMRPSFFLAADLATTVDPDKLKLDAKFQHILALVHLLKFWSFDVLAPYFEVK